MSRYREPRNAAPAVSPPSGLPGPPLGDKRAGQPPRGEADEGGKGGRASGQGAPWRRKASKENVEWGDVIAMKSAAFALRVSSLQS